MSGPYTVNYLNHWENVPCLFDTKSTKLAVSS